MRITKTVTVNVRIPKFESVCREMWTPQGGKTLLLQNGAV